MYYHKSILFVIIFIIKCMCHVTIGHLKLPNLLNRGIMSGEEFYIGYFTLGYINTNLSKI